jgi:hypothetical protein
LFFAAWSFKQSTILLLLGTLLALVLRREWMSCLLLLGPFTGLVAVVLLVSGEPYYQNVLVAPSLAPWMPEMIVQNASLAMYYWGFILLILPLILLLCFRSADRKRMLRTGPLFLALTALLTSLPAGLLASGRFGAWSNYLFEPWLAGMLLTGLVCQHASAEFGGFPSRLDRGVFTVSLTGLLLLAAAYTFSVFEARQWWDRARLVAEPYPPETLAAIRQSARPLLCDDPRLVRLALAAEAGEVAVIDDTLYWDALRSGQIRDGGLAARIEERWYATLWLRPGKSPWEEVAVRAGYCLEVDGSLRKYVRSRGPEACCGPGPAVGGGQAREDFPGRGTPAGMPIRPTVEKDLACSGPRRSGLPLVARRGPAAGRLPGSPGWK